MKQAKKIVYVFVTCAFGLFIYSRTLGDDIKPQTSDAARKIQNDISKANGEAITNIQTDLQSLTQKFPVLSSINSTNITSDSRYSAYSLSYWKDAYFQHNPVPNVPINQLRQTYDKLIVNKDGAVLTVYVGNVYGAPFKTRIDGMYDLIEARGAGKIILEYGLELNTPDPELQKELAEIVEKQAGLLKKELEQIVTTEVQSRQ
jgi:hypothetical protein